MSSTLLVLLLFDLEPLRQSSADLKIEKENNNNNDVNNDNNNNNNNNDGDMSLKVLLPLQHTGFQTSPILKLFLAT